MEATPESRLLGALKQIDEVTRQRPPSGIGHDDADDIEGTIASDDAVGFNPLPLLRLFDEHGVRVVIMGQVAGILHGSTELTGDLDLLWSGQGEDAAAMSAAFIAANGDLEDDDGIPLPVDAKAFALPKVQFRTDSASGDCCTPALPWGALDVGSFIEQADSAVVDGVQLHYVSRQALIAMRLAVGREKDQRRAAELQQLR